MKVGDLVKIKNSRARSPLIGIIFAIELPDPIWPEEGDRYVVRWQGFDDVPGYTQRCWRRDIQVLCEG